LLATGSYRACQRTKPPAGGPEREVATLRLPIITAIIAVDLATTRAAAPLLRWSESGLMD